MVPSSFWRQSSAFYIAKSLARVEESYDAHNLDFKLLIISEWQDRC
jgi:hypothetical protein